MELIYLPIAKVSSNMDLSIIPECYVDTNLIETLVPPNKQYNHQKGCGTVTKVMKERFTDRFALGIIDKDRTQVDYLKEFTLISDQGHLLLHKHRTRSHFIIQINPAMECFIIEAAESVDISLSDFDLPTDLNPLKKISKSVNSKSDVRFKRLFKALKKEKAPSILLLFNWLSYLKENRYNIDLSYFES